MPKEKEQIDTKEDKISRIFTAISMLNIGESISVTNLSRKINMHHDTLIQKLEEYEPVRDLGWTVSRDKFNRIRMITKTDEEMNIRKEIREMQKDIKEIKRILLNK